MASRYFTTTATHIHYSGHLVVDAQGGMTLARAEPRLRPGERAIALNVTVPKALFRTPALRATIALPDGAAPSAIQAETVAAVEEAVRLAADDAGLKVTFASGSAE